MAEHRARELEVDDEAGAWYVRILDEDVHHTTEGAPINIDWTRDGTMIGVEILGKGEVPRPARCGCAHAERLYDELEQAYVSACAERDALQGQLELDSKRVYNAQIRAEKLPDTIDRVRTVLLDFGQLDKSNQTTALEALEKIDEIIDGDAPPAPQVFFPGATVPAGTHITALSRIRSEVHVLDALMRDDWVVDETGPYVEIFVPSPEGWQAAVARARAEREES